MATVAPTVVTHYDLTAGTLAEVIGIFPAGDEAGRCSWEISYEHDGPNRFGLPQGLRVTAAIRIEMPRWVGRDQASEAERREWDRFYQALLSHERGHEQRTRNEVPRYEARLARTPVADLGTAHQEEIARIQRVSDAYDTATDHGRTPAPGTVITVPREAPSPR
jgi:predicted secreted Zn-dependent protease